MKATKTALQLADAEKEAAELISTTNMKGYKYEGRCQVCIAISPITKKNIRAEVDAAVLNTQKAREGLEVFIKHGLTPPPLRQMQNHINKHSPYVREGVESRQIIQNITGLTLDRVEAEDAIQEIVDRGMSMLRSGDLPVTEKIFITALKEANKNKKAGDFEKMVRELDEQLFNRKRPKIIDGEVSD